LMVLIPFNRLLEIKTNPALPAGQELIKEGHHGQ
jgi:hypothetical protein